MSFKNVWAGVAFETGGEIIIGRNHNHGWMFSLGDHPRPIRYFEFGTDSVSLGAGLGGSAAIYFVLGLNMVCPQDADGVESGADFSLDLVLGAGKYLRSVPEYLTFFYEFEKGAKRYLFEAGKLLELAERYKRLKSITEVTARNFPGLIDAAHREPALIQIPVTSTGLRVSLNYRWAVTDVLSYGSKKLPF